MLFFQAEIVVVGKHNWELMDERCFLWEGMILFKAALLTNSEEIKDHNVHPKNMECYQTVL